MEDLGKVLILRLRNIYIWAVLFMIDLVVGMYRFLLYMEKRIEDGHIALFILINVRMKGRNHVFVFA